MRSGNVLLCGLLVTIFTLGCSSGGEMPVTPGTEPQPPLPSEGINDPFASGATQSPGYQPGVPGGQPQGDGDSPPPQSYLGGGHPIEGVNNRRNNRSPYMLPQSLEGDQKIDEIFDPDYPYTIGVSELLVDGDERIFLGCFDGGGQSLEDGYGGQSRYHIYSFRFGEDFGDENPGGKDVVLTSERVYTTSYKSDTNEYSDMGYGSSSSHKWSYVLEYDPWPVLAYEVSTYWGSYSWYNTQSLTQGSEKYGDWDGRYFDTIFPLPEGKLLISYKRPSCSYNWKGFQLLDDGLNLIGGAWLGADIIGGAYDENNSHIYATTDMADGTIGGARHLYCFDADMNKLWDADEEW